MTASLGHQRKRSGPSHVHRQLEARICQSGFKTRLVDAPQGFEVGLLAGADAKGHAAIVAVAAFTKAAVFLALSPCAVASFGRTIFAEATVGLPFLIGFALAAIIAAAWYAGFTIYNRRRGIAVLGWVQAACIGRGRVADPQWRACSSLLKASLKLRSRWFEDARLTIRLLPRPLPLQWLLRQYRRQDETLTFEADLGFPPGFRLDVLRHRWSGRSGNKDCKTMRTWSISRPGPVILSTKNDWPAEVTSLMNALTTWRDQDFMSVRFDPRSPHFSATVKLASLSDEKSATALLGLFRELAAGSSAKQH